jgi:hypothetical protein
MGGQQATPGVALAPTPRPQRHRNPTSAPTFGRCPSRNRVPSVRPDSPTKGRTRPRMATPPV